MTFASSIHYNIQYDHMIIIRPLSPMDPTLTMMPVCCFALSAGCWPKPPPPFWWRGAKYLAVIRGPTVLVVRVEIMSWKGGLFTSVQIQCMRWCILHLRTPVNYQRTSRYRTEERWTCHLRRNTSQTSFSSSWRMKYRRRVDDQSWYLLLNERDGAPCGAFIIRLLAVILFSLAKAYLSRVSFHFMNIDEICLLLIYIYYNWLKYI